MLYFIVCLLEIMKTSRNNKSCVPLTSVKSASGETTMSSLTCYLDVL